MSQVSNIIIFFLIALSFDGALSRSLKRSSAGNSTHDGKIVGGYEIKIQDAPYQVFMRTQEGSKYYICGGSILNARSILTAAHCVKGIDRAYIRIGSTDAYSGGKQHSTNTFKIHPKYNPSTKDFDIAIVRLNENMVLDGKTTKAIKLPKENAAVKPNTEMFVSGWGDTSEGGSGPRNLRAVKVPAMKDADCKKAYSGFTSHMFCAGFQNGGKDSCQGDSGGPAVNGGIQHGVVSFGEGCARKGYPGVYTKVSSVRQWIKTNAGV